MSGAFGPVHIPDWAWRSAPARTTLQHRDTAAILRLAQQYTGASQHRLANAVGILQGPLSEILRGARMVTALEVYQRIADGLTMPDHARLTMGLAPRRPRTIADAQADFGEVVDVFSSQADASHDIRAATDVQILAARGLGPIGLKGAMLRDVLARTDPPATVTIMLNDLGAATRLAKLNHPRMAVYLYDAPPVWRITGLDDTLYVSAFANHREGRESPTYKIASRPRGALYHGFVRALGTLRDLATQVI